MDKVKSSSRKETVALQWIINKDKILSNNRVYNPIFQCAGYTWKAHVCTNHDGLKIAFEVGSLSVVSEDVFARFSVRGKHFFGKTKRLNCNRASNTQELVFDTKKVLRSDLASQCLNVKLWFETKQKLKHIKSENKKNGIAGSLLDVQCTSTLALDFLPLHATHEFSDIVLKADGQEFPAHKVILAARSPVFAAALRHDFLEKKTGVITITDISAPILKHLLQFIYSGSLSNVSLCEACALYAAANKYALLELKEKCVEFMSSVISCDNVVEIINLASLHSDKYLIEVADNFLQRNFPQIEPTTTTWGKLC